LARLRAKVEQASKPWWQEIRGTFANDPIYDVAMRLGRKWRESQRPKPKRKAQAGNGRA
jgi:hypothetical protein